MPEKLEQQLFQKIEELAEQVKGLAIEIRSLKSAKAAPQNQAWFYPKQAAQVLGEPSERTLRDRIKDGTLPPYNRRTGKGCWINVGKGAEKPRYKIHVPNARDSLNRPAS